MAYTRKTSDIITSTDLDYVLEKIKDNSEVARLLLKKRHSIESLVDNHINYISISNSDKTRLSYLTPERFESLLANGEDVWTSSKRFHVKPGSFISKIFKNVSSRDVEIFSTLFRNFQTKIDMNFHVISGNSIKDFYHYDSYYSETGSLGASCMKHDKCQDYLDLYVENPELVKMLILLDKQDKLVGRALLWTSGDTKIMDRIYSINDENYQFHFKKWANENGFSYKKEQKWNNTLYFETNGKVIYKEICLDLKIFKFINYPYMDTFKFIDLKNGKVYNYQPNGVKFKTISSTEGLVQSDDTYAMCEKTKTFHSIDSINFVPNCGLRVSCELTVWSDVYNLYILREDANYDDELRGWIYQDDDLNNHVLINKKKSSKETPLQLSGSHWADLFNIPIENVTNIEEEQTQ